MGETRAQLVRSQELMCGELAAQVSPPCWFVVPLNPSLGRIAAMGRSENHSAFDNTGRH